MSRDLISGLSALTTAAKIEPFFAVRIFFDTQTLNFWSGLGDMNIDGVTYVGTGKMLQISDIGETAEIAAKGAVITLSGIPSDLLSLAISEPYQGRECRIFFGAKDVSVDLLDAENTDDITTEGGFRIRLTQDDGLGMSEIFSGYIDTMNIDEGAETSTIALTVESKLIDLERPRIFRYTDQSHKARYPADKGFEFVEDLQDKVFSWGRK